MKKFIILSKLKKRKQYSIAALAMLLTFAITACGAANNNATTDNEELVIGVSGSISTLDPNQEAGILNYYIATIVGEGLVGLNNDGQPIPGLATSWETEDYAEWIFTIRSDARFSDGSEVTIDDIIWSIERAKDPAQSPGVSIHFPEALQTVEKVDDTTLRITLDGPHPSFIWAVSNVAGLFVTSQEWGEEASAIGSPQDLLLGSGPYQVVEFSPGSHVSLQAQDYWWGDQPEIQNIRFDFIADDATRLLAFTQGSIDFALNIPIDQSEQWEDVDGATVEFYADRSYYGLTIDPTVEPFDNEHVRRTVAYAMNAGGVVDSILGGHATVATAITPPDQFASIMSVDEARSMLADITHYTYDMERAREEFELSGVEPFETTIYYPDTFPSVGRASLVLAEALDELGITANVTEIPIDQWLSQMGSGEHGIAWMIYFATSPQPQEIASWLLDGEFNPANFTDEEIADLMASVVLRPAEDGLDDLIRAHDLAQARVFYVPVWWGESAIAWNDSITVSGFNSYTMLSENWVQHFEL